jgi:hypothetical protein
MKKNDLEHAPLIQASSFLHKSSTTNAWWWRGRCGGWNIIGRRKLTKKGEMDGGGWDTFMWWGMAEI